MTANAPPSAPTPVPTAAPTPAPQPWHSLPNAPAPGTVLGRRGELQDGQVLLHEVPATGDAGAFRVLLLRSGDQVLAYANRCAHFGVPLAARQEHMRFEPHVSLSCNVHYARYRWSDGLCVAGDCEGESLVPIPLAIDADGTLRIATAA